ncbi:YciI family protein [Sphingomonas sp. 28-63-12]|uniref:YciI family protein n=1 Tax=Sphingomonas sp. 28-63-12 TaxID=1970434 RepID=UPI000BCEBE95|nr:MAG: hypothetical protein B7Y47_00920 [Sphingomonas sp. 28-63-12]
MKHYAILCWDAPGSASFRAAARDAHFARIDMIIDSLAIAGPLKDASGAFAGSLVIVKAADEAGARAILEADPYFAAGVWERFEISEFVPAAGEWIGGKIW